MTRHWPCVVVFAVVSLAVPFSSCAQVLQIERVDVSTSGAQARWGGLHLAITGDGRFVAFNSASGLVPGVGGGVYLRDRQRRRTECVSLSTTGVPVWSGARPAVSDDGRFVCFVSSEQAVVPGYFNGKLQAYVRDRHAHTTEIASISSSGAMANDHVSNGPTPVLSADGRFVAFSSYATNLVPGDTNGQDDVFVHDRRTGQTERVSVSSTGAQGEGSSWCPALSGNGRFAVFTFCGPAFVPRGGGQDVYRRDRAAGRTTLVSVARAGHPDCESLECSISRQGRFVAFESRATNLVPQPTDAIHKVFVRDMVTGQTDLASVSSSGEPANGDSCPDSCSIPYVSDDGRIVVFDSWASNLVANDTNNTRDVFAHDRVTGRTIRVNTAPDGTQANGDSQYPSISADGLTVAFESYASNLVPGDTNGYVDVFVAALAPPGSWPDDGAARSRPAVVSGLAALPTPSGGAQVVFALSAPATVTLTALNLAGRVVATVAHDQALDGGTQTLVWSGRAGNGLPAPNGTYLLRIEAKGDDGTMSRALARVSLKR